MPSPTATMRPTSAETRLASKSFKRSFMTSEISRVLMLNSSLLRGRQPAAQLLQSSGDTRVDDPVTVLQFHAAEDARIVARRRDHWSTSPSCCASSKMALAYRLAAAVATRNLFPPHEIFDFAGTPACLHQTLTATRCHLPPVRWLARSGGGAWVRRASRR